jgi:hypothetical protein
MTVTLHDEMVAVLKKSGRPMKAKEIAAEVNRRGNYERGDGGPVPSGQIRARANNYRHLFVLDGPLISLVHRKSVLKSPDPRAKTARQIDESNNSQVFSGLSPTSADNLAKLGFRSLGNLGQLLRNGVASDSSLQKCGIYAIIVPADYSPSFVAPETAMARMNVINPWSIDRLEQKWIDGVRTVYIGLVGAKEPRELKERITDLLKHGRGKTTDRGPHKGGEILWQLEGYERFELWILPTEDPPIPRNTERALIKSFEDATGRLPFANRQR